MSKLRSFLEHRRRQEMKDVGDTWLKRFVRKMLKFHIILSTWFYVGKIPIAPGTIGSFAAYPVYCLVLVLAGDNLGIASTYLFYACAILTLAGLWAIRIYGKKEVEDIDHKSIVLDEVIGQLLTLAISLNALETITRFVGEDTGLLKHQFSFFIAFFTFRCFDIAKPFGIRFIDEKVKNEFGVILDDVVAACFSGIVIVAFSKVFGLFM
jgi:phosphatidylglycerophosphatase A